MISLEQAFENFLQLNQDERIEVLTMIIQHKAVLHKLLPDAPLVTYLVTGQGPEDNPMIMAYKQWLASLNRSL